MTHVLTVDKVDTGGVVHVRHIFYGNSRQQCLALRDQHGEGCRAFGPALERGTVAEEWSEIPDDQRPGYDDEGDTIDV